MAGRTYFILTLPTGVVEIRRDHTVSVEEQINNIKRFYGLKNKSYKLEKIRHSKLNYMRQSSDDIELKINSEFLKKQTTINIRIYQNLDIPNNDINIATQILNKCQNKSTQTEY